MLLGAIADDLTGATDLALMLVRGGMRTVQVIGVPAPRDALRLGDYDAVVVALKSRTIAAGDAITQTLASAAVLREAGAHQLFFKYCSTFDSTDKGNIGPVAEALLDFLKAPIAIACPAFPANARSVYMGHLFVGKELLSESPMRNHPLTPMRDANLVRVLQRQCEGEVGLVAHEAVDAGPDAIRAALKAAMGNGKKLVIVDAICDRHLVDIGQAIEGMPLVTGGSGVAMGLPTNFLRAGQLEPVPVPERMEAPEGRAVILAGSCSQATRNQVAAALEAGLAAFEVDADKVIAGEQTGSAIAQWARDQDASRPCLVYSSADPAIVEGVQKRHGVEKAGAAVEAAMAECAAGLARSGFSRFVVAGGETSGAVVNALGVSALEIGPEIDPGVPWTRAIGGKPLVLALKSGNFGAPDFFAKAWDRLS